MDSHVWRRVYSTVRSVDRSVPRTGRSKRFSDVLIVGMFRWSVWHDRPLCWACDRIHYGSLFRPRRLPFVSQFCKRIKSGRCQRILEKVYESLARNDKQTYTSFLDARPLPVGPCSKDHEAKAGRVYGGLARGYKLHELVLDDGRTAVWSLMPLNVSELIVARVLIDAARPRGLVLADSNYDSGPLYEQVAQYGGRLLAVPRKGAGKGHGKPIGRAAGVDFVMASCGSSHDTQTSSRGACIGESVKLWRRSRTSSCLGANLRTDPALGRRKTDPSPCTTGCENNRSVNG